MVQAIFGSIALPLGVVNHEGSTLIVLAKGLRLSWLQRIDQACSRSV
jgi:hypothetical protein